MINKSLAQSGRFTEYYELLNDAELAEHNA